MNSSNTISKLAGALTKAQVEMPVVKFDAKNPFLKNKYATLQAVVQASVPVMHKYGLSIAQFSISQDGRVGVRTILMHESGEWIEDVITVVPETAKGLSLNQATGVTLTYLRRYSWASVLGLVADEDGDGDTHAETKNNEDANAKVTALMAERTWSFEQMDVVLNAMKATGGHDATYEDVQEVLRYSLLPENAPTGTIGSWFKVYLKSDGDNVALKAMDANNAYTAAKSKSNGGKTK